ncbi:MAG: hypothetical protein KJ646_05125 [Nanoarchaeota archaeon]|nr:hypothetical protein [Nanoarchaeota archaeon]MBU4116566.1 hypothetical protein [Nanoarchaeota archaeon]
MKRKKYTLQEKRKIIIEFLKKNPKTTYKDIRLKTKLHPERIFTSLKEAFKEAKIKPPRNFDIKTKKEKKIIIINYIKKNPKVGGHTIKKDTKINFQTIFKNTKEAFEASGVQYPREIDNRIKEEKRKQIIEIMRKNPLLSIAEIISQTKTQPYSLFKNINEIYKKAGIKKIKGHKKWKLKKKQEIIKFIKENPLSTQREINQNCKTHVQDLFNKGIFEAYNNAKIEFPFERLKLYGIGIKNIRDRAKIFEKEIAIKLSGYGKVNRLVKTKRGFADIILERKNKKVVIEIKDYQNKDISMSQIKQLNRYLEDCRCTLGFLICHKKPKKDKFLINKNKIFILEKEELKKIPKLIDGTVG